MTLTGLDGCRHSRTGGRPPDGIAVWIDLERGGVFAHKRYRPRHILRGRLPARAGTVFHYEGVIALCRHALGDGEALVQRADVGKTAARRNHGKGGVVPALEHEDAGVTFARVAAFVGFGINLVKHRLAARPLRRHMVERFDDLCGMNVAVIRHQLRHAVKRQIGRLAAVVPRQQALGKTLKSGLGEDIADGAVCAQRLGMERRHDRTAAQQGGEQH